MKFVVFTYWYYVTVYGGLIVKYIYTSLLYDSRIALTAR